MPAASDGADAGQALDAGGHPAVDSGTHALVDAGSADERQPIDAGTAVDAGDAQADQVDACPGAPECDAGEPDPDPVPSCDPECGLYAHCVVTSNSAACACDPGFEGDGFSCRDIDECAEQSDRCSPYAWCTNTTGSYFCECYQGMLGDGFTCEDVDQCATHTDACDAHASCNNVIGLYECSCNSGFSGDGFVCGDVDECAEQTDACDPHAICSDLVGSYDCACDQGYVGDGLSCARFDGCDPGGSQCDSLSACEDPGDGYRCRDCPLGYGGTGATVCIPRLIALTPSAGHLSPAFAPTTLRYDLTTGLSVASFQVTPQAPAGVVINVDGVGVISGAPGPSIALPALGASAELNVVLDAPNGEQTRYQLGVERNYAEQAYVKASNPDAYDGFGSGVASDGEVMVVGASGEDSAATGVNGSQSSNASTGSGAAYVFRRVAGEWRQEAYLKASNAQGSNTGSGSLADGFGEHVAMSGDRIVVGASYEDSGAIGVNGNQADNSVANSGAAYVFKYAAGVWQQEAYLKASNTGSGDFFGSSVAISGDVIVVGAEFEDSSAGGINHGGGDESAFNAGAAYVYRYSAGQWVHEAYLKPAFPNVQDHFGLSVAVDGDVVVVGAPAEDGGEGGVNGNQQDEGAPGSGAAYVFRYAAGAWTQEAYLKARVPGGDPAGGSDNIGDYFGMSVAVRADAVLVGARYEASGASGVNGDENDNSQLGAGAAYLFRRDASGWAQEAYLKASAPRGLRPGGQIYEGDIFGTSVALGDDVLAVGASGEDSAARRVNGDENDDSAPESGAVYVFRRGPSGWAQSAYLKSSNSEGPRESYESSGDTFGWSVAISGQRVIASAPAEDANASGVHAESSSDNSLSYSGAVFVFE